MGEKAVMTMRGKKAVGRVGEERMHVRCLGCMKCICVYMRVYGVNNEEKNKTEGEEKECGRWRE